MPLTENQIRYIKNHSGKMSAQEMAKALGISAADVASGNFTKSGQLGFSEKKFSLKKWIISNWLILTGLAVIITLVYVNTLNNVFISDDLQYMVNNPKIKTIAFLQDYPFTIVKAVINWLTYKAFGMIPPPFHAVNIIFHIFTVWLFYLIVYKMTSKKTAIITALLWSVHPILTESITWIGGGGYILFTCFFFASFALYLLKNNNRYYYPLSIFFFLVMLGTSEKSIPLSMVYFVYEISLGSLKKNWKKILPYLALTAIWAFLIFGVSNYFRYRVQALHSQYYMASGYDNPLIQVPVATARYIHLLFWPDRLSFYQSDFIYKPFVYFLVNTLFVGIMGFIIYSFFKFKYGFFWISVFFIGLLPSLTPLRISWWVAERYVYTGSAGIIAIAGYLLSRISNIRRFRYLVYVFIGLATVGLMTRTIIRNTDWLTADSLWIATGKTAPLDPKTHNNLGDMYSRHGDYQDAIKEFQTAVNLQGNYADGYHNLAVVYVQVKEYDKAIESLNKALSINPQIWQSELLLSNIYQIQKKYDLAVEHSQKALKLNPNDPITLSYTAMLYHSMQEPNKAQAYIKQALKLAPNDPTVQSAAAEIYPSATK